MNNCILFGNAKNEMGPAVERINYFNVKIESQTYLTSGILKLNFPTIKPRLQ